MVGQVAVNQVDRLEVQCHIVVVKVSAGMVMVMEKVECIEDSSKLRIQAIVWFISSSKVEGGCANPFKSHGLVLVHCPVILYDNGRCRLRSHDVSCSIMGEQVMNWSLAGGQWDVEIASGLPVNSLPGLSIR